MKSKKKERSMKKNKLLIVTDKESEISFTDKDFVPTEKIIFVKPLDEPDTSTRDKEQLEKFKNDVEKELKLLRASIEELKKELQRFQAGHCGL